MTKNMLYLAALFVLVCISANAQEQGLGCVYMPEIDGKVPFSPQLMTRDYTVLPKRYSIKNYCPTPKSQEQYGTCTSWATTYAARTIAEAISYGWTNTDSITKEAFSPIFVYKQIVKSPDCQEGSSVAAALSLLQTKGVPKLRSFDVRCADYIPDSLFAEALNYRIDNYTTLFNDYSSSYTYDKVQRVKKAIAEDRPVVFAMDVYVSFDKCDSLWNGVNDVFRGSHAMCVVGYDDEKYGGAFEIMNSWGTDWAHNGYVWVKYEDFRNGADYAYDVYLKKKNHPSPTPIPNPEPIPIPIHKKYSMSGDMFIVESDGGGSPLTAIDDCAEIPFYYLNEDYPSGKKFRLVVSNHEAAWVYMIASDMENNVSKLFPYADNISAYLNYSENNIALPDETHEFELDATPGTDYFCVLYSQEELDINQIVTEISQANGSFYDKIRNVLGDKLAPKEDIRYVMNDMGFSAKTDKPVVPLIVEIPHQDIKVKYQ